MVGRRPGKTRPLAGHNGGVPKVASSARTDVPPPNGPGWRPDAPTTSAPKPLPQTAVQTSHEPLRATPGKAVLPRRDASDEVAACEQQDDQFRDPCSDLPAGQEITAIRKRAWKSHKQIQLWTAKRELAPVSWGKLSLV